MKGNNLKQVQQIMGRGPTAALTCLCTVRKIRVCVCRLVTLEKYFKEEYFMKCEYYIKLKCQCAPTTFTDTQLLTHLPTVHGCCGGTAVEPRTVTGILRPQSLPGLSNRRSLSTPDLRTRTKIWKHRNGDLPI